MSGWVAGAVVVGSVAGGLIQGNAAKGAARTQADAAARAQGQLLASGQQASELYAPYTERGQVALNKLSEDPYFSRQFTNQDLNASLAPGYDFRLGQGQRANIQAANASGGAMSGNALRGLQDYTQNFASGEYTNAFNQFQAQRTNIYNQLKGIADMGLTGTTGQANAMIGTGTNVANISSGLGNAQAASQIAQGNAYTNAIGGITNAASFYGMNQQNPYQSMGISGNQGTGFTYNSPVGPTESGGNLSSLNIRT